MFRLEGHLADPEYLPPYVEVAKLGSRPRLSGACARRRARSRSCGRT